jgi:hypothetical protein
MGSVRSLNILARLILQIILNIRQKTICETSIDNLGYIDIIIDLIKSIIFIYFFADISNLVLNINLCLTY